jgi:hypothetical protein
MKRMPLEKVQMIIKNYRSKGRRNQGRPLKGLLDVGDRNGSTSGPAPC